MLVPPTLRRPRRTGGKPGAPFGNANALKHGRFTRERRALRADIWAYLCEGRRLVADLAFTGTHIASTKTVSSPAEQTQRSDGKGPRFCHLSDFNNFA